MNLIKANWENIGLDWTSRFENVIMRRASFCKVTTGLKVVA